MEFTLGEECEKPSKKELSAEELSKSLDRLIQDKANNQRIHDWVEVNRLFIINPNKRHFFFFWYNYCSFHLYVITDALFH